MRIHEAFDYPADPQQVYAMMTDEAFLARVCEATHAITHDVAVTEHGDGATVITTRELPTDNFPDFAKSMVGPTITVVQTLTYPPAQPDGSRRADVGLTMGSAPVGFTGSLTISPGGAGTHVVVEGDLKSGVPFLGGKIEKAAAPSVIAAVHKEHEVGTAWLSEHRP